MHLVEYVEKASKELWDTMKGNLSREFSGVLTKAGWPSTALDLTRNKDYEAGFVKLLDLQEPCVALCLGLTTLNSLIMFI